MKSLLYLLFILIFFSSKSFSENYKFSKIIELNEPWGSSFINNNEIIITEKSGKLKLLILFQKKLQKLNIILIF